MLCGAPGAMLGGQGLKLHEGGSAWEPQELDGRGWGVGAVGYLTALWAGL